MIALLFDTETTGLIENHMIPLAKQPHIIEWYSVLVDFDTGAVLQELEFLIRPPVPLSDDIIRITGLTDDTLKDKPPFSSHAATIKEAVESAPLIVAANLSFDQEMTDFEFERLNTPVTWPPGLCTVEATVHLKGFRLKLVQLHELLFGQGFPSAHRARIDVEAMARCVAQLIQNGEL